jgi:excisionase family DNA binding protein
MPRTKTKPPANATLQRPAELEVLTLAEAAAYLRVPEADLLRLVSTQGLPGRKVGVEWRFLKLALQRWLATASCRKGLLSQLGAARDDPYLEEMLKEIYQRRGRPETEEGYIMYLLDTDTLSRTETQEHKRGAAHFRLLK